MRRGILDGIESGGSAMRAGHTLPAEVDEASALACAARVDAPPADSACAAVERATRHAVRAALAAELHDDLGVQLTALRFALARIETFMPADAPRACSEALRTAERTLDDACVAMRRALDGLRTTQLEGAPAAALRRWASDFGERTGIDTMLRVDPLFDERVDGDAALDVLRLIQEACSNAARHGRAGRLEIDVDLDADGGRLAVRIIDDGCGFSPRAGDCGAMRQRAKALGGTLRVQSDARGTQVRLDAPLHGRAASAHAGGLDRVDTLVALAEQAGTPQTPPRPH